METPGKWMTQFMDGPEIGSGIYGLYIYIWFMYGFMYGLYVFRWLNDYTATMYDVCTLTMGEYERGDHSQWKWIKRAQGRAPVREGYGFVMFYN
jgi:hypothetical protein